MPERIFGYYLSNKLWMLDLAKERYYDSVNKNIPMAGKQ